MISKKSSTAKKVLNIKGDNVHIHKQIHNFVERTDIEYYDKTNDNLNYIKFIKPNTINKSKSLKTTRISF